MNSSLPLKKYAVASRSKASKGVLLLRHAIGPLHVPFRMKVVRHQSLEKSPS